MVFAVDFQAFNFETGSMRAFLNSPGNKLFAGGISFALGLHLGGKKCDLKKMSDRTANFFMQKYEFLP